MDIDKMEPDFKEIENKQVGYKTRRDSTDGPWLENLTFKDFIPPYSHKANSYKEVYVKLSNSLDSAIEQQNSVTNKKRSVMIDVLATATLQREAMMNSLRLIQYHYLRPNENNNSQ